MSRAHKTVEHESSQPVSEPLFVNIREAARMLGTTEWGIRQFVWSRQLIPVRFGKRKYSFSTHALREFAQKRYRDACEGAAAA